MVPDFIVVGNVARDVTPGGWQAGGTALYAAAVARGLGRRVGVLTAATADVVAALPHEVEVIRHPAAASTSFENVYTPHGRIQYLRATGESIPPALLPDAWARARVALLGPVYHEVAPSLAARFTGIVGVCGQGYLRRAGADGRVTPLPPAAWDAAPMLRHVRALFVSCEDIGPGGAAAVSAWTGVTPIVVVTDGPRGAWVHAGGERRHIDATPAREVDPTGAGDAFAAAYLIALDDGADPWEAARFAAAAAAIAVETAGPAGPSRNAVVARQNAECGVRHAE